MKPKSTERLVPTKVGPDGCAVLIYRSEKAAIASGEEFTWRSRAQAVVEIRWQVLCRAEFECERCCAPLTWTTMEMNEKIFRSHGGEISLENCEALCHNCHQGKPYSVHPGIHPGIQRSALSMAHAGAMVVLVDSPDVLTGSIPLMAMASHLPLAAAVSLRASPSPTPAASRRLKPPRSVRSVSRER